MADTISFTQLGLTGTGIVQQTGAQAFNKLYLPAGSTVVNSSGSPGTTLTNPAFALYLILASGANRQINLMPMNQANSPSLGSIITLINIGSSAVEIFFNDGSIPLYSALQPQQSLMITPNDSSSANGSFIVLASSVLSDAFAVNTAGVYTTPQAVQFGYNFDGNTVILTLPTVTGTATSAAKFSFDNPLPLFLRPNFTQTIPVSVENSTTQVSGIWTINTDGTMTIGNGVANGNFTGSGTAGFFSRAVAYDVT